MNGGAYYVNLYDGRWHSTNRPIIGGYVCEELSWSWVLYINSGCTSLALLGLLKSVKPDAPNKKVDIDWIGFLVRGYNCMYTVIAGPW